MTRGYVRANRAPTRGRMILFAISMIVFLSLIAQRAMYLNPRNHVDSDASHPLEKIKLLRIHKPGSQIRSSEIEWKVNSELQSRGNAPENVDGHVKNNQKPSIVKSSINDVAADGDNPQPVSGNLHVFYYSWYGSPQFDKKWLHWDHQVRPILLSR